MRYLQCLVTLLCLLACWSAVSGYGTGAPDTVCGSMQPGHGVDGQSLPPPYNISLSTRSLRQGARMHLVVQQMDGGPPFKGFLVQVLEAGVEAAEPVGRFISRDHGLINCGGNPNTSITHSESREKAAVKLHWLSPAQLDADVVFRVSVVRDFSTFWVQYETERVRVSRTGEELPQPAAPTTTTSAATSSTSAASSTAAPAAPTVVAGDDELDGASVQSVYDGCMLSKGCFALGDGCIESRNCRLMMTHARRPDGSMRIQLVGRVPQSSHYLAVALSRNDKMGDDAVMYCVQRADGSGFQVLYSQNVERTSVPVPGARPAVTDVSGLYEDGLMLCEFTHPAELQLGSDLWRLDAPEQHLLIATGPAGADSERRPQYHHAQRRASSEPLQLGSTASVADGGVEGLLVRVHGALMVVAWMGTASTGMLLARYYKHTWLSRKLGGVDLWFQGHRSLMVLTVLLSLAGVVCIAVELEGWTKTPLWGGEGSSPHPLLGAVCVVLACLQPVMAACRPHPGTPRRPVFNWLHWLVGSAAHLLAISAIFFAVDLSLARLPRWTYWLMCGFVAVHVLSHLLMSLHQCWSDRRLHAAGSKHNQSPAVGAEAYNLRDMAGGAGGVNGYSAYQQQQGSERQDAPGTSFRRTLLGVYCVVNLLFVLLLVLMIVFAPADNWLNGDT